MGSLRSKVQGLGPPSCCCVLLAPLPFDPSHLTKTLFLAPLLSGPPPPHAIITSCGDRATLCWLSPLLAAYMLLFTFTLHVDSAPLTCNGEVHIVLEQQGFDEVTQVIPHYTVVLHRSVQPHRSATQPHSRGWLGRERPSYMSVHRCREHPAHKEKGASRSSSVQWRPTDRSVGQRYVP